MPEELLDLRPLNPFGAQVALDLSGPLAPGVEAQLRAAFARHHLLLFRGQSLAHDQLERFIGLFGPLLPTRAAGSTHVSNRPDLGALGTDELAFHSDLAFTPKPYRAIALHAVDVDEAAASTRFADGALAWARLPADLQEHLAGLTALHVYGKIPDGPNPESLADQGLPAAVHPLRLPHPVTDEPILYVSHNQCARIRELPVAESDALIARLLAHTYAPPQILEHRWRNGDLVLWDNFALTHARGPVASDRPRTLLRAVSGEATFAEQCPQIEAEYVIR